MSAIEEIKKRIDIVDYIGQHVSLKKTGRNYQGLCPFHTEKSPSFIVSPDRQRWHCFGACHEGGDVVSFVMKYERFTFGEALEKLAPIAGVEIHTDDILDKAWSDKKRITTVNQLAADYYYYIGTKHPVGARAREYLLKREIPDRLITQFKIGYAPHDWDSLSRFLLKRKCNVQDILDAGLAIKKNNNQLFDRFRARIMFPLTDPHGTILGFSGRIVLPEDTTAKYINSPETALYHKRETLFGIQEAKNAIQKKHEVLIMEGEFDVLTAHRFGYTNSVGIKGTALTVEQLQLLKRYATTLIFCLDTDDAGIDAAKRGIALAESFDVSLYIMQLPNGKDPADVLSKNPEDFKKAYKERMSIYEFLLKAAVNKNDPTSLYGKKAIVEEMGETISGIQNPVVREYVIQELSKLIATDPQTISETLRRRKRKRIQRKVTVSSKESTLETREDYLLALMLQSEKPIEILQMAKKELEKDDYVFPSTYEIVSALHEYVIKNTRLPTDEQFIPLALRDRYNVASMMHVPQTEQHRVSDAHYTVLTIKEHALRQAIKKADDENLTKLITKLGAVEKELHTVYNTEHDTSP